MPSTQITPLWSTTRQVVQCATGNQVYQATVKVDQEWLEMLAACCINAG